MLKIKEHESVIGKLNRNVFFNITILIILAASIFISIEFIRHNQKILFSYTQERQSIELLDNLVGNTENSILKLLTLHKLEKKSEAEVLLLLVKSKQFQKAFDSFYMAVSLRNSITEVSHILEYEPTITKLRESMFYIISLYIRDNIPKARAFYSSELIFRNKQVKRFTKDSIYFLDNLIRQKKKQIDRYQVYTFTFTFFITIIISIFSFLHNRKIKKDITLPMEKLLFAMSKIAKGNYSHKINLSANDEFGALCSTFNAMSIEINESHNTIKKEKQFAIEMLNKANKADAANDAKSKFLSSMSHELRTPMNAVLGFAQLLASDPLTEEQHESVNFIINGGESLLSLIDNVLDLSKIEKGHVDVTIESINVQQLVSNIIPMLNQQASKQSITLINNTINEAETNISVDYEKIKQVLLNFSSNALKYNSKKGSVTYYFSEQDNNKIRICVSDTGKGVSDELLPSLFEPFNRLDMSNSAIQGTGIGLTISKELVELMGGKIGVFNNPDKGLTFWVEFDKTEHPSLN